MKKKKSIPQNFSEIKLLDPEEIAARRIPIEDTEFTVRSHNKWHCAYCNKKFAGEATFMRHYCESKRRVEEIRSPLGQAAYSYYSDWMKLKKYSPPSIAAFIESKLYRSFVNFAQLIIDANIANPDRYIKLMIEADVQPVLWCRQQCYALYLEWTDKLTDPLEQVQESINYLLDICEKENAELSNVFTHLGSQRMISLVRQRRLSPWLLFCSCKFGELLHSLDKEQMKAFNAVVNASYWSDKFKKEKITLENVKTIVKELEL